MRAVVWFFLLVSVLLIAATSGGEPATAQKDVEAIYRAVLALTSSNSTTRPFFYR